MAGLSMVSPGKVGIGDAWHRMAGEVWMVGLGKMRPGKARHGIINAQD
jgi:hypothetical protein